MFRYTISVLFLILLAVIFQQFLPTFTALYNARVFLLLIVFLCVAVTVPLPVMFLYALICGFFWDAQCAISIDKLDLSIFQDSSTNLRFGMSILLFGLAGALMHGFQQLFLQGKWYLSAVLTGIATFVYLLAEYGLLDFLRGAVTINRGVMLQISYTSLFSVLVSPLIFGILFLLARLWNHTLVETKRSRQRFGLNYTR